MRLLLCLSLPLPILRGSLIVVGRFGACFLLVLAGFCTWLSCTDTGADADAEQLALTDQLFDAALGEPSLVAKGFRLGSELTSRWHGPWLLVCSLHLLVSGTGLIVVVIVGILWLVALLLLLLRFFPAEFSLTGGLLLIFLAVRALLDCCRWTCRVTQPVQLTPFDLHEVVGHLSQNWVHSVGTQHQTVFCGLHFSLFFKNFKRLSPTVAAAFSSRLLPAAAFGSPTFMCPRMPWMAKPP